MSRWHTLTKDIETERLWSGGGESKMGFPQGVSGLGGLFQSDYRAWGQNLCGGTKVTRTRQEISARAELGLVIRLHKELESRASSERAL